MRLIQQLSRWPLVLVCIPFLAHTHEEALELGDGASSSFVYTHGYYDYLREQYGYSTAYGKGGYGDPANAGSSLKICQPTRVAQGNCVNEDPDRGAQEWRFIKGVGWRKFSKYGAARKDWWDYKRTLGWPFHTTYGTIQP